MRPASGTLVFDQPSVKDAAGYIHGLLLGRDTSPAIPQVQLKLAEKSQQSSAIKFAISARMPCSFSPKEIQEEAISSVPYNRWDLDGLSKSGKAMNRPRFGGWLKGVDYFDSTVFGISAPEAELMDPQQRLLLEAMWETVQVPHSISLHCHDYRVKTASNADLQFIGQGSSLCQSLLLRPALLLYVYHREGIVISPEGLCAFVRNHARAQECQEFPA